MRFILVFLTIFLLTCLGSSSPIDPARWKINRPTPRSRDMDYDLMRYKRVASHDISKGGHRTGSPTELEKNLRKGEKICGSKVCRLKPGEVPKLCPDGLCQYNIKLYNGF